MPEIKEQFYHIRPSSLLFSNFERRLAGVLGLSEAKVNDLGLVALREHDVVGLKVSVFNTGIRAVQVCHGFSDLGCDCQLERLTEILVFMDGCGERARQELHKDEGEHPFVLIIQIRRSKELDNVRMRQAIENVHFVAKLEQDFFLIESLNEAIECDGEG